MQRKKSVQLIFVFLIVSLFFLGCASTKFAPTYFDKDSFSADMDNIIILPIIDIRKDKSLVLSERWPHDAFTATRRIMGYNLGWVPSITEFKDRTGYEATLANDYGEVKYVTEDDIKDADPSWIRGLGPNNSNWVLLLMLEDLVNRKTYGVASTAECSGYLFDKTSGKLVWKHEAVVEKKIGGLGALLIEAHRGPADATWLCFYEVYEQFPKK